MHRTSLAFLLRFAPLCRTAVLGVGLLLPSAAAVAATEETEEFIKSSLGFYQAQDACVYGAVKASGGSVIGALKACSQQFEAHKAHLEEIFNNRAVKVFMHFRKLEALDKAQSRFRIEQGK